LKGDSEQTILTVNVGDLVTSKYPFPESYYAQVDFRQGTISPDGGRLFFTDAAISGVRVMSTETFRIVQTLQQPDETLTGVSGIAIDATGSSIYVAWEDANTMKRIGLVGQ
ncbi:MAG: hypothetical protein ACTHJ0_02295, partial [Flavipsychrobacter sp.]